MNDGTKISYALNQIIVPKSSFPVANNVCPIPFSKIFADINEFLESSKLGVFGNSLLFIYARV